MRFEEYGTDNKEVIFLLHGGGLAPWNYKTEAALLKDCFHVVVPVMDGHNGSDRDFKTIEENAREIISFIDKNFGGQVLLVGGLSLGGQVLVEMLSQRKNICKFAIIESALVVSMTTTARLIKPTFSLCYPLIKKRWFAKLQFAALHMKQSYFESYFVDSAAISEENLISFLMANATYKIKESLSECEANTLVLVGGKEQKKMKKSAEVISRKIPNATLEILPGYFHGDLSLNHGNEYVRKIFQSIHAKS